MKIVNVTQGTPEWLQHRAAHFNASDAPAMMGMSLHRSRTDLLNELSTGIAQEFSDYVQKRVIEPGHSYESHARKLAEDIIGEDLYPCVGIDETGKLSASFDGLTLDECTSWEHKRLNDDLRSVLKQEGCTGADLPAAYRVQMEHQCLVSNAQRVLFMASEWRGDELVEELHCWYTPDPKLRDRILAGWEQLEKDLATHQPIAEAPPAPIGRAPETLPSLRVEAQGMVTYSNLAEFREQAMAVLGGINRDLATDEDFADAEQTVKWCKGVEDRLATTKAAVLAQMQSVDEVCRTIDDVAAETRRVRLELDKLVKAEKENRRAELVKHGVEEVREHYATINASLGVHAVSLPQSLSLDVATAIKGLKTLSSIRDAVATAVASAKIDASQRAERVRANVAVLDEFKEHAHLIADRVVLCASKDPDDLRNLVTARIAEHKQREADRLEAERARIRKEEEARAAAAAMVNHQYAMPAEGVATGAEAPAHPEQAPAAPARRGAKIKLGDINARIAPLSITADGLAQLGFRPVATQRAAKLYAADEMPDILRALIDVLHGRRPTMRKTA